MEGSILRLNIIILFVIIFTVFSTLKISLIENFSPGPNQFSLWAQLGNSTKILIS
jgi:hypothetical protein